MHRERYNKGQIVVEAVKGTDISITRDSVW